MSFLPLLPKQQRSTTRYEPEIADAVFRPNLPASKFSTRSHCWLFYREEQERDLIIAEEAAASPLYCYGNLNSYVRKPLWQFSRDLLVITTDAELSDMVIQAFDGVLQRIQHGTPAQQIFAAAVKNLEQEETECRQCNIVEPWVRDCTELSVFKEFMGGKLTMWNEYLHLLNLYQEELHLVREEKLARIRLLGQFVSCKSPHPCQHLLWDMEVLEESNIPLEPEVNLLCLFTSIVISQQDVLHTLLLTQWKWGLHLIKKQERLARKAFRVLRRVRCAEQKRYDTLIAYHFFCLKLFVEAERVQDIVIQDDDGTDSKVAVLRNGACSLSLNRRLRSIISPRAGYYIYLHIVETLRIETSLRERIFMLEYMDFCFLMQKYEGAGRRVVAADEEEARRCALLSMEEWARSRIDHRATEPLRMDLSSDTFYHRALLAMAPLCELDKRRQAYLSAEAALTALCIYEHKRRSAFVLLEFQLRTEIHQLICRTDHILELRVVAQRMHKREVRLLERDETRRRVAVVKSAETNIVCHKVAHEWMVEQHVASFNAMPCSHVQLEAEQLLAVQQPLRDDIEALWQHEHNVLFAQRLCVPHQARQSLDMRQTLVTDLLEFVDDTAVLGVFA